MALTRRKFVLFAMTAGLLSFGVMVAGLLAADLYLHGRAERSAGLNRYGYRGPVAGRKRSGELRVVMLGGSTVFGYGVLWQEAIPAVLERLLNESRPGAAAPAVRVINLGYNGEGAYAMLPTLNDFAYLDPDVVCLYPGDTDLMGDGGFNTAIYRHGSAVFRMTGYFPILPLALREKASMLETGGHLGDAYAAALPGAVRKPLPRQSWVSRASSAALETIAELTEAMGRQLDRLPGPTTPPPPEGNRAGCPSPWIRYCDAVEGAIRHAIDEGQAVVVMLAPNYPDADGRKSQASQQAALTDMVGRLFGDEPRVVLVPLSPVIDMADPALSPDGAHATPEGNAVIAKALRDPVRKASAFRRSAAP